MSYGTREWRDEQIRQAGGTPNTGSDFAAALNGGNALTTALQTLRATSVPNENRTASDAQQAIAMNSLGGGYDFAPTVNGLFQQYLGRDARPEGMAYWTERLQSGSPMDLVAYEIRNSPEAQQRQAAQAQSPDTTVPTSYASAPVPTYQSYNSTPAPSYTNYTSAAAPTLTPYQSAQFNFEADPGYQFRQNEGNRAIQNRQLASGNFFSGGALREAADYNSGLASQEYGNAFQRYMQNDANSFRNNRANNSDSMTTWQANDTTGFRNNQANFTGNMASWQANDAAGFRNNQANNAGELGRWSAADNAGYRNFQGNFNNALTLDNTGYNRALQADNTNYQRWVDNYNRQVNADNTNWSRLTYLDTSGQNATNAGNVAGANSANVISQLLQNGGAANAGGAINQANATTNAITNSLYALRGGW